MSSIQAHYDQLLGPVYTWMAGGWEAAVSRNRAMLDTLGLAHWPRGVAVDLGCGSEFLSMPVAEAGMEIVALDLNNAGLTLELDATEQGLVCIVRAKLAPRPTTRDRRREGRHHVQVTQLENLPPAHLLPRNY